jgi:hypothetical protein
MDQNLLEPVVDQVELRKKLHQDELDKVEQGSSKGKQSAASAKVESSDEENNTSSEDEEGADVEFPRQNAQELYQFLHRELNNLQNMEDG